MDTVFFEFLTLLLRWGHLIAGIAWIGASFYFVSLDQSLRSPRKTEDLNRGVDGERWAVHGGGVYCSQKFLTGPKGEALSEHLHWSKWEAYSTWLTGFLLFASLYWYQAPLYLIDDQQFKWDNASLAIVVSASLLIGTWIIYHCACKLIKSNGILSCFLFFFFISEAWILCEIFSGRGAYLQFGAMLGTLMAANVFFVIIPGQKKMVTSIRQNEEVDPQLGKKGKQRSVHNTYFTLPVIFCMMSQHFASVFNHPFNGFLLIAFSLAGVLIRAYFVYKHQNHTFAVRFGAVGGMLLVLCFFTINHSVFFVAETKNKVVGDGGEEKKNQTMAVTDHQILKILKDRCTECHGQTPLNPAFSSAPMGMIFENKEQLYLHGEAIHRQTVLLKSMPLGNVTKMRDDERQKVHQWYEYYKQIKQ